MAEESFLRLNGHINAASDRDLFDALQGIDKRHRMTRLRELARLGLKAEAILTTSADRIIDAQFASYAQSGYEPGKGSIKTPAAPGTQRLVTAGENAKGAGSAHSASTVAPSKRSTMMGLIDTTIMK